MRRGRVPFDVWSAGRDGSILFCVQHFRLAARRARRGRSAVVPIYKTERGAAAHAERYGHRMAPADEARALALRWFAQ